MGGARGTTGTISAGAVANADEGKAPEIGAPPPELWLALNGPEPTEAPNPLEAVPASSALAVDAPLPTPPCATKLSTDFTASSETAAAPDVAPGSVPVGKFESKVPSLDAVTSC